MKPIDHIKQKVIDITNRQYKLAVQPQRYFYHEETFLNIKRNYV